MKDIANVLDSTQLSKLANEDVNVHKKLILSNKNVVKFLTLHKENLNNEVVNSSLPVLNEFVEQNLFCAKCKKLSDCPNMMPGFRPEVALLHGQITLNYLPCEKEVVARKNWEMKKLITTMYLPIEIKNASLENFTPDTPERVKALRLALTITSQYKKEEFTKGLYLHGAFGIGKTYLLGALANEFAAKGIPSVLVYWPDFLRELKSSFENNRSNQMIDAIRSVAILMIDDIGAEVLSPWIRDEVLGIILQFRMQEKLTTFLTSNYNFTELEEHLTITSNGMSETTKAKRIMERLRYLVTPIELRGENRRL